MNVLCCLKHLKAKCSSHTSVRALICLDRAVERARRARHTCFLYFFPSSSPVVLQIHKQIKVCAWQKHQWVLVLYVSPTGIKVFLPSGLSEPPVLWQKRADPLQWLSYSPKKVKVNENKNKTVSPYSKVKLKISFFLVIKREQPVFPSEAGA